jgi:DNA-binding transcriptional LysR family regulator
MELNYLRYFYEVAKAGSFTEAARQLHVSQSALSKAVGLLEDREGVRLLTRSKKGVELTEIGTQVFLKSETIFKTLTEIELTCKGTQEHCEGLFSFGSSDHVANYFLVKSLQEMRAQNPKSVPSVFSGTPNDTIELILKNEIEFGLFFTKVNIPTILYEPLFQIEMAIVYHPKLLTKLGPDSKGEITNTILRKIFTQVGFIGSIKAQYQNHPSRELMDFLGEDPNIAFESNSQEMQKRLCLAGAGVAYLARFMVEKEIAQGTLKEIRLKKPITLTLVLAKRKGRELSLSARTFLEILKKNSREE